VLTSKRRCFILAHNIRPKFGTRSVSLPNLRLWPNVIISHSAYLWCLSDPFLVLSQVAKHLVYNVECCVFSYGARLVAKEQLVMYTCKCLPVLMWSKHIDASDCPICCLWFHHCFTCSYSYQVDLWQRICKCWTRSETPAAYWNRRDCSALSGPGSC